MLLAPRGSAGYGHRLSSPLDLDPRTFTLSRPERELMVTHQILRTSLFFKQIILDYQGIHSRGKKNRQCVLNGVDHRLAHDIK
ncbi:hypothetical protein BH20PSE1_BH20PSE1_11820 [soil metagenome]